MAAEKVQPVPWVFSVSIRSASNSMNRWPS
jgi:hypothetical protein